MSSSRVKGLNYILYANNALFSHLPLHRLGSVHVKGSNCPILLTKISAKNDNHYQNLRAS